MKVDTIWPADAVEFCPHPLACDTLVCGTYNLCSPAQVSDSSQTQQREGKCLIYRLLLDSPELDLVPLQVLDMAAVLDMKWAHNWSDDTAHLAIADSEGHIITADWSIEGEAMHVTQRLDCRNSDILCLSLDWSNRVSAEKGRLIVSSSDGYLSLIEYADGGELFVTKDWYAHDYEPWIAAWNYWDTNICYSGGDDLKLKAWDTREHPSRPIFTNSKFDAGITTIQSSPHDSTIIAVGSYDEKVRIFDARKPLHPTFEAHVGGGVWRVKWHPSERRRTDLLVACMHDGFKVLRFEDSAKPGTITKDGALGYEVMKRFDANGSLAYGVDWCRSSKQVDETFIASCSFYDHTLHTWTG